MDLTTKIIVFVAVLLSDVVAALVITRKLNAQGRSDKARLIAFALLSIIIVVGVVLFVLL